MSQTVASRQAQQTAHTTQEEKPLLDQVIDETCRTLDRTASRYQKALAEAHGHTQRAILLGRGVSAIRGLLTDAVMKEIMPLMNSQLGFMTDRGPQARSDKLKTPYSVPEVRECLVQAILQGFFWTNNEFNIIAGRFMGVLNGWKRKCEELPGVTDLHVIPGVPRVENGQTMVRVAGRWRLDGQAHQLTGPDGKPGVVFPVPSNEYSGPDAAMGKAERRAYKLIHKTITGSRLTDADDADDGEIAGGLDTERENVMEELSGRLQHAESERDIGDADAYAAKHKELLGETMWSAYCRSREERRRQLRPGREPGE